MIRAVAINNISLDCISNYAALEHEASSATGDYLVERAVRMRIKPHEEVTQRPTGECQNFAANGDRDVTLGGRTRLGGAFRQHPLP